MSDRNKRLDSNKRIKEIFKIRNEKGFSKKLLDSKATIENRYKVAFEIIPERTSSSSWCSVKLEAFSPNDLKSAKVRFNSQTCVSQRN